MLTQSIGHVLRQARAVRDLSVADAARAAGISAAYLSRLESDAVRKPSPNVLLRLSTALGLSYAELMRLSGYHVPGETMPAVATIRAGLFDDLTPEEEEELVEYLAWFRSRRSRRDARRRA